jgi:hypothetical protein
VPQGACGHSSTHDLAQKFIPEVRSRVRSHKNCCLLTTVLHRDCGLQVQSCRWHLHSDLPQVRPVSGLRPHTSMACSTQGVNMCSDVHNAAMLLGIHLTDLGAGAANVAAECTGPAVTTQINHVYCCVCGTAGSMRCRDYSQAGWKPTYLYDAWSVGYLPQTWPAQR